MSRTGAPTAHSWAVTSTSARFDQQFWPSFGGARRRDDESEYPAERRRRGRQGAQPQPGKSCRRIAAKRQRPVSPGLPNCGPRSPASGKYVGLRSKRQRPSNRGCRRQRRRSEQPRCCSPTGPATRPPSGVGLVIDFACATCGGSAQLAFRATQGSNAPQLAVPPSDALTMGAGRASANRKLIEVLPEA
jgi:hypothetical protein